MTEIPIVKTVGVSMSLANTTRLFCQELVGRSSKRMKLVQETKMKLFFVSLLWLSSISPRDSIGKRKLKVQVVYSVISKTRLVDSKVISLLVAQDSTSI